MRNIETQEAADYRREAEKDRPMDFRSVLAARLPLAEEGRIIRASALVSALVITKRQLREDGERGVAAEAVSAETGEVYRITAATTGRVTCTCKDAQKARRACKHGLGLLMRLSEEEQARDADPRVIELCKWRSSFAA